VGSHRRCAGAHSRGGLYWFAPWKLFTNTTVRDPLALPAAESSSGATPTASTAPTGPSTPAPNAPVVLVRGTFVSHEHPTTGTARVVRNPDGTQHLELVGLSTSDGPDLRVWLTDQAVTGEAHGFDRGRYLELGRLKGNHGDQVYAIPANTDLGSYRSVAIWCLRFSVSFGDAELAPN
jgi:hypothetical protein